MSSLYIILHQISFLLTGLCTTLGVQWLFYRGAATSISLLPQLSSYTGMLLVGLFIPILLKQRRKMASQYKRIVEETVEINSRNKLNIPDVVLLSSEQSKHTLLVDSVDETDEEEELEELPSFMKEEGPIPHLKVIKLAVLDIIAIFPLTIGFSIIGSGMYQVIYSSVVIWCAILTWLFMGRALATIQWLAIIGTSIGLGISSLDSVRGSLLAQDVIATTAKTVNDNILLKGTLLTLFGTFVSACIYVYADNILSKSKVQPLPARVCCWMGVYTSIFTWIWISVYTLPQFDTIIHIDSDVSTLQVILVYVVITLANAIHSWNYYELIERTGNVATGILQGLRAILVYGLSHMWYCNEDAAQCFTTSKGCGSFIVIGCVLLFTLGKK
ncbi:unnamed protein product [Mucor hiemalis]